MKTLTLEEVRKAVQGRWLARGQVLSVDGVSTDSRSAGPGQVFFALRGPRFDGHDFLADAAAGGCVAAVVDADVDVPAELAGRFDGGLIAVADTVAALGRLAAYHRRLALSVSVVAVTGSAGKTTVKQMIHHILSGRFKGMAGLKSYNNEIGVPLTLLGVAAAADYVVCEIGSNHPGEVAALAKIARPDVAVITSVGPAHLGQFGGMEQIAVEKASLLAELADGGLAVIWADSELLDHATRFYEGPTVRFGDTGTAELRLTGYKASGRGCWFEVNGRLGVELPLLGRHNATNAMAAIAVAQRFGFTPEAAATALADFPGAKMRLEWVEAGEGGLINDAYNANPASVSAAASVLADIAAKRRVLVLGDMLELGDSAEQIHHQLGGELAAGKLDLIIGVGALGRYVAEGAAEAGGRSEGFETVEAAGEGMAGLIEPGDVVLIKGSRAMQMERLVEPIRAALRGGRGPAGGLGRQGIAE